MAKKTKTGVLSIWIKAVSVVQLLLWIWTVYLQSADSELESVIPATLFLSLGVVNIMLFLTFRDISKGNNDNSTRKFFYSTVVAALIYLPVVSVLFDK